MWCSSAKAISFPRVFFLLIFVSLHHRGDTRCNCCRLCITTWKQKYYTKCTIYTGNSGRIFGRIGRRMKCSSRFKIEKEKKKCSFSQSATEKSNNNNNKTTAAHENVRKIYSSKVPFALVLKRKCFAWIFKVGPRSESSFHKFSIISCCHSVWQCFHPCDLFWWKQNGFCLIRSFSGENKCFWAKLKTHSNK